MGADSNIKTVKGIYEAFGRGDVEAILGTLCDDVDWASEAASNGAPWFGVRKGKKEVASFFEAVGSTMEVLEFTPYVFAASDEDVLTVIRYRAKSRSTGREIAMDLHHLFRFRDGEIYYYRGTEDTAQTELALRT